MAHSHDHSHDQSAYYTEQLCTVGICGAFGAVAVLLYVSGALSNLLAQGFLRYSVLAGGITVLVLVSIRAIALWIAAGREGHVHSHDHAHDCCDHDHHREHEHAIAEHPISPAAFHHHEHEHAMAEIPLPLAATHHHHHAHNHSHGGDGHTHDHTWAPIRYLVLAIPVLLYFLVPLEALSGAGLSEGAVDPTAGFMDAKGYLGQLQFKELEGVPNNPTRRQFYEGKIAQLTGQFVASPSTDRMFSLVRMKIRCCAADAVPLPAAVIVDDSQVQEVPVEQRVPNAAALNRKWVEVTCQIQFRPRLDQPNEWVVVLVVRPTKEKPITDLVKQVPPDPDPYL
jgi:hypothetical protein